MSAPEHAAGWGLVAAAQGGDREAFGRLYARYAGEVARVITARLGNGRLTEDLTQETFLRGLRRIDSVTYRGHEPVAWFKAIARNLVVDHFRSHRHQRERLTPDPPEQASSDRGPDDVMIAAETAEELHRHVAQLPPDQRRCLQLRFWDGLSTKQTAARMGRHDRAVKSLQHRAVCALRASLSGDSASLVGARQAVTDAAARVAAQNWRATEATRARQLGRCHDDSRVAAAGSAALSAADDLGVA